MFEALNSKRASTMIYSLLQTDGIWPLLLIAVAGYYGWVIYTYFRIPLTEYFQGLGLGGKRKVKGGMLQISWDDLVFAFAIQRKLNQNPAAVLNSEELNLLDQSPFREVLGRVRKA